jgi:hypothetical protein
MLTASFPPSLSSFTLLSSLVRLHLQYFAIFSPPCLHSLLRLYKKMTCTFSLDSQSVLPVLVSLLIVLSVVALCRSPSASRTGLATKASQRQEYVALCVQLSVNQLTSIQHYNCDFSDGFPNCAILLASWRLFLLWHVLLTCQHPHRPSLLRLPRLLRVGSHISKENLVAVLSASAEERSSVAGPCASNTVKKSSLGCASFTPMAAEMT